MNTINMTKGRKHYNTGGFLFAILLTRCIEQRGAGVQPLNQLSERARTDTHYEIRDTLFASVDLCNSTYMS